MNDITISNNMIEQLRSKIKRILTPKRFEHTLGVENAAVKMGTELQYNEITTLKAAALLHDITKEYSFEKQLKICEEFGIILRRDELECPQVIHSITAAAIIPANYSEFASKEVISAVRWHTTGRRDMTLSDKIICLADYIEDGRNHASCINLRRDFWNEILACKNQAEKVNCLNKALKTYFENTVIYLNHNQKTINLDTIEALKYITSAEL